MKVARAYEVLRTVKGRGDIALSMEEQTDLVTEGLLRTISTEERAAMERDIKDLEQVSARVRAACRGGDAPYGGKVMMAEPSRADRGAHAQDLQRLESMLLHKATLESMASCPSTGCSLALTCEGEKALPDLEAWRHRFGGQELRDLLTRIGAMRADMSAVIVRAANIAGDLRGYAHSPYLTSIRAPALVLAERGDTAQRAVSVATARQYQGRIDGDKLMMASLLSGTEGTSEELARRYDSLRQRASAAGLGPDEGFQALSLLVTDDASGERAIERISSLRGTMPLGEDDLAWLAVSSHDLSTVSSRYRSAVSGLSSLGLPEDDQVRRAASILAGSDLAMDRALQRYGYLHSRLQPTYPAPQAAAAMLSILPMEPEESLAVLRESIGVVSRANFFDDAEEVNNLALILASGLGPRLVASGEGERAKAAEATWQPPPATQARSFPAMAFLPFWVHRSYNQPTLRRISTHPAHMHTVPYFG
ncbi:MAG: hypothetical protein MUE65_00225 [Methanomassiliicoccales archaeon]|nr:hypothetical protein [Methanomassiliicoccales archaeon]